MFAQLLSFFVTTLRGTAVSFLRLVVSPLQFTSHLVFLFIAATGCPDVDLEVLATALPAGSYRSSWFNTFLLVVLAPWCTSRFIIPFDVPDGPPSTLALGAGSTWPPPDYEQLTKLWTSPLLIQLPYTMMNQTKC
ncbi:calcium-transporting ATPase 13, plasma membrane-type [Dorcoceras hygrometricum]|uniref:Calcium-transporting ATPase 13, plasma membrane-type n=1 Tax=Dorcoceras hygrometricum TaxID=472368 RepID=A0A2Z7BGK1_9LAMI|nr:calcium-transporting ATPase 13, plasma membrane-type [Dorcoceras hygrometricum]